MTGTNVAEYVLAWLIVLGILMVLSAFMPGLAVAIALALLLTAALVRLGYMRV